MVEIKETCIPGTVIRYGNSRRKMMNSIINILLVNGYNELSIPIIQSAEIFKNKVGEENNNLMYNFTDRGNRELCLAPEYTAIIQHLSKEVFKHQKNVKIFYVQECFRGEKLEYKQYLQIGVEIINASEKILTPDGSKEVSPIKHLEDLSCILVKLVTSNFYMTIGSKKQFNYYLNNKGFDVSCSDLVNEKEIVSGGEYQEGCGFGINFDKLLSIIEINKKK